MAQNCRIDCPYCSVSLQHDLTRYRDLRLANSLTRTRTRTKPRTKLMTRHYLALPTQVKTDSSLVACQTVSLYPCT